jgi:signal transduction histidine kinase
MVYLSKDENTALFWCRIVYLGVPFITITNYHFSTVYLKLAKQYKLVAFFYILSFISLFFTSNYYFISGVKKYFWGYYAQAGFLHSIFLVFWVVPLILSLRNFYQAYHQPIPSLEKLRRKLMFWATLFGYLGAVDFIPNYGIEVYPFGYIPVSIFVLTVVYAIVKYRLMDIKVVFTRAGTFLFVYTLTLGFPFWLGYQTKSWLWSTSIMAVLAMIGPMTHRFVQRKVENALLAQQKRYQQLLLQAASGMAREHNLDRLLKLVVYIVQRAVKIHFAVFFLANDEEKIYELAAIRGAHSFEPTFSYEHPLAKFLTEHNEPVLTIEIPEEIRFSAKVPALTSVIIPVHLEKKLEGFLFLSDKKNNDLYSSDDMKIFSILSSQAALAIENCLFLQEFKNTQDKIFAAEKLASIGGMSEGVAHQVKNRLNYFSMAAGEIKLQLEYLKRESPDLAGKNPVLDTFLKDLGVLSVAITNNVKRADDMIRGILNFARAEEKETFFSSFSLREAAELTLIPLKAKHHIRDDNPFPLEVDAGPDDTVYGVRAQIVETIYNICDNAYEACLERKNFFKEDGEKRLFQPRIRLKLSQNHDKSIIEISDNGIGIKDEDIRKIFAPFFTTKSSYKSGTGIGVYVVKRIIEENHHGRISFESKYLEGTKFTIELPKK